MVTAVTLSRRMVTAVTLSLTAVTLSRRQASAVVENTVVNRKVVVNVARERCPRQRAPHAPAAVCALPTAASCPDYCE